MRKLLAIVLSSLLVATPAFADRTVYAPVRLAPTATAGTVLFGDSVSAASPAISFSADPDTGIYRVGGNRLGFSTGGAGRVFIDDLGWLFVGNAISSSSPTTGNISGTLGSGTNIAGGDLRINGGQSTGSGAGGSIIFRTSAAGASGSSSNGATERMRITSAGQVLINQTSSIAVGTTQGQFQQSGTDSNTSNMSLVRWSADGSSPYITLGKSRGATVGTQTIVSNGDRLGGINFAGSDGTDLDQGAAVIESAVDGVPATNSVPSRLSFYTTAGSATSVTERMRITSAGEVGIGRTPSSGYMLDIDHATDTRIALYNAGTRIGILQAASSLFSISGVSTNPIALLTNGVERARVKSNGQLRFVPLAADPAGAEDGDVYYNSTTNKLRVRAGGAWVDLH